MHDSHLQSLIIRIEHPLDLSELSDLLLFTHDDGWGQRWKMKLCKVRRSATGPSSCSQRSSGQHFFPSACVVT